MELVINTTEGTEAAIWNNGRILCSRKSTLKNGQSDKLLTLIDKAIKRAAIDLKEISEIRVFNKGGSFTSLRVGVATANALGYGLGIPVREEDKKNKIKKINKKKNKLDIVLPEYDRGPNITKKIKKLK